MKEGDRNSRFFHKRASNRKRRNKIKGLRDGNGNWETSKEGIEKIVVDYFHNIFKGSTPDIHAQDFVLQAIQPRVTTSMNLSL